MPDSDRTQRRRGPTGRPIFGTLAGLALGLLVAVDLILASVIRFDSLVATALPPLGATLGFGLGWFAPIRRRRQAPDETPLLDMVVETDDPELPVTSDLRPND